MRRAAAIALLAALLAGCGGSKGESTIVVSAASSLRDAFPDYAHRLRFTDTTVRFSFGGSDDLAAQIRAGARPDVFAAANAKLPDELFKAGLVDKPVAFTANRLVLAVPSGSAKVRSLADLAHPGVAVAIGAASVPIGSYTRQVLGHLGVVERNRILANVKTEEPDVAGIIGKLTQRAVDAGLVYATDVNAAKGALRAIPLAAALQPTVVYEAAVVKGANPDAQLFVDGLRRRAGQVALRRAGFLPLPG